MQSHILNLFLSDIICIVQKFTCGFSKLYLLLKRLVRRKEIIVATKRMDKSLSRVRRKIIFPMLDKPKKIKFMDIVMAGFNIKIFVVDFHCWERKCNSSFHRNQDTV